MRQPKKTQMYNLVYIVNGKVRETLESNKPLTICKYKKANAEASGNYRSGLLQCRKV